MSRSSLYRLETLERTSGGGRVVESNLRKLADRHPDVLTLDGDAELSLVPRNWAAPSDLRSGRFALIPQNAWPWHGVRPTLEAKSYCSRLRVMSEISMRRSAGVVRLGRSIPPIGNSSERIYPNILDEGFDRALREGSTDDAFAGALICVGSPTPYRGLATLAMGFQLYQQSGGRRRLVVCAGHFGHLFAGQENVALLPEGLARPYILQLLQSCASAVLPSTVETSPVGAIEASALAPCVIASDISGHREVLDDASQYFPVGDAEALARLLAMADSTDEKGTRQSRRPSAAELQQRRDAWCDGVADELRQIAAG